MSKRYITTNLLQAFETNLIEDEKSKHTINKYLHDLQVFATFAKGSAIDKPLTLAYKEELEDNYAPSSANSMIAALNSFLRFVGWDDCCLKQFKIQKKAFCSEETELSKKEYLALIHTAEK